MNRKRPRVLMTAARAVLVGGCAGSEEESIEDFIPGFLTFDVVDWDDNERHQALAAQEAIAACMAKRGFEYIPYVPNNDKVAYNGQESDAEYVQEYGLGVSYHVLDQELHGGDAIWESLRDGDPWDFEPAPVEPGTELYKKVEAIFKEEVAIARVDFECSKDLDPIYQDIYEEHEKAYLEGEADR